MTGDKVDIYLGQKELVLARFNAISPELKIMFGNEELTVQNLISHVEKGDEFGRKIVQTQIRMLKVLTINV